MSIRSFFTVKTIPTLFWSAPKTFTLTPPVTSLLMVSLGLAIFGVGEALLVAAGVGVSPWTVFAQGVSLLMGWTLGTSTFAISCAVLLLWVPLRQMPGLGTILNAIIIALVIDATLPYLPQPHSLITSVIMAACGVFVVGFGSAVYLIANLGAGPRDGLMTGLNKITGQPFMNIRIALEVIVVTIGYFMGGVVGVGTVLFALGIGPCVSISLHGLTLIFKPQETQR